MRRWLAGALCGWFVLMTLFVRWGLPTTIDNPLLFGGEMAWPASAYDLGDTLTARRARAAGADVDLDPIVDRGQFVDLTATHADRAAIMRRYRLFSHQPDEMITFMALQRMQPRQGDFDPKLYQYGGAYVYSIGAALAGAHLVGFVDLRRDVDYFLENPDAFGRFYVVARLATLVFGALALWAAYLIGERLGGVRGGWLSLLLIAVCPVFVALTLEAKPHLPSVCLLLWATNWALGAFERQRGGDLIVAGALCGVAWGLVLTGVVGAALLLATFVFLSKSWRSAAWSLGATVAVMLAVYAAANPYVIWHLLRGGDTLASNLGNSTDMYSVGRFAAGAWRVAVLTIESCGWGIPILGAVGLVAALRSDWRATLIVVAAPLTMLLICMALGAGKPAEYARFLLLPVCVLAVFAGIGGAAVLRRSRVAGVVVVVGMVVLSGAHRTYMSFFLERTMVFEPRRVVAQWVNSKVPPDIAIGVVQEPAPYAIPPLDFAHRRVVLLPREEPADLSLAQLPEWLVLSADNESAVRDAWWRIYYDNHPLVAPDPRWHSPITWASKATYLLRRTEWAPLPSSPESKSAAPPR